MARKILPPVSLPRETNIARVRSQERRTVRLLADARRAYRANPCNGTHVRRMDRTLGALAVRAKVAFVRANISPRLHGAVRLGTLRARARAYRAAMARWTTFYRGGVSL